VYKADQVGNAPVVMRTFLAGMVELIVRKQMSARAIPVVVPGKGCWNTLVATEHETQYVFHVVLYVGFPEAAKLAVGLAMEDASVQDGEKHVLVGGTHVQVAKEHLVVFAAVYMKHSGGAYVFVEDRPEVVGKLAAGHVEAGAELESLAASEVEYFAVEVKLADVDVVAVQQYVAAAEVELVHVAALDEPLLE